MSESLADLAIVSRAMANVLAQLGKLAETEVTVTLTGETGTGKDVLAHAVHDASKRAAGAFVVFDCGAVPANLVDSELFGHQRGAFTGAHSDHAGAFERARGGTLFLDEIGELPLDLQPRLLRALENRSLRRVGGTHDRPIDVRIIAATNRDIAALVAQRHFRQDLYFRLAVALVHVPPLRDRIEDIPLLTRQLLIDLGRQDVKVTPDALAKLQAHAWPGNVRELKNVLAYALAFVDDAGTLEERQVRFVQAAADSEVLERLPLGGHTLARIEEAAIRQTLTLTRGNKTHAARMLGISPSTLHDKLKRYDRA